MLTLIFVSSIAVVYGAYPYTDQNNRYKWTQDWSLSDEFYNQNTLNTNRWYAYNPTWLGRQPGLFDANNVAVKNGKLYMYAKVDWAKAATQKANGYYKYTTSAVTAKKAIKYGYIEIKAKVGGSRVSSAFWLSNDQKWSGGSHTEIDIFEQAGTVRTKWNDYHIFHSNTHIFALKGVSNSQLASKCGCTGTSDCKSPGWWSKDSIRSFSDDYHIYGMWWTSNWIKLYVDGELIRTITNKCLHQELYLKFDRETFPNWFGLPEASDLPDAPFIIEYVRTWKQGGSAYTEEADGSDGLSGGESAAISLAVLMAVGCIGIGMFCIYKRRKNMKNDVVKLEKDEVETPVDDNKDGYDMSPVVNNNGDSGVDTPNATTMTNSNEQEIEIDVDVQQDEETENQ